MNAYIYSRPLIPVLKTLTVTLKIKNTPLTGAPSIINCCPFLHLRVLLFSTKVEDDNLQRFFFIKHL